MNLRRAHRWVSVVLLAGAPALAAASCGGSSSDSTFNGGSRDGSTDGPELLGDAVLFGDGNREGGNGACTPKTCASAGYTCGQNGDGCGGVLDCGTCKAPEFCGGGGYSQCGGVGKAPDGAPLCVPETCKSLGYDCGPSGDGCGGLLQCGTCSSGQVCGGKKPSVCGTGTGCTNLCKKQVTCDGGTPTTITGRVVAGTLPAYGAPDPVPNVLVYVANAPLQPFTQGVTCGCPEASGDPLVWTTTAIDGTFTLPNVPVTTGVPVVIQLGRWRREVTFDITTPCVSTPVGDIRMPRTKTDGFNSQADIPFTALSTGHVDALECVLLKMGVDVSEFTAAGGSGRINLFEGNGSTIAGITAETNLTSSLTTLSAYDQVLLPCWGGPVDKPAGDLANVVSYTSAGGRVFATHFSYTWLYTNVPFNATADWTNALGGGGPNFSSIVADIDTTFPRGSTFGQWMEGVSAASGTPPSLTITNPRNDFNTPVAPSLRYMYADSSGGFPLHYTFDTPWQAKNVCGRVVYSDFHVSNPVGTTFPDCSGTGMTPQEKALEYMIWDLAQCVGSNVPSCTPRTCDQQNINCGPAGDGCGGLLQCGTCPGQTTCGGGGVGGQCGYPDAGACKPTTCHALGVSCGPAGDGCGGLLECGSCSGNQTCGGGGTPGQCGGGSAQ